MRAALAERIRAKYTRTFHAHRKRPGTDDVLDLCHEIERLRAELRALQHRSPTDMQNYIERILQ